jgi:diguanylate cyclase (GGDEF)-like protein
MPMGSTHLLQHSRAAQQPSWVRRAPAERSRQDLVASTFCGGGLGLLLALGGLVLIAVIGWLDLCTGHELSFAIFYLIPIACGAWWGGFPHGILLSLAATVAWHGVDVLAGSEVHPAISLWNGVVRFSMFVVTSSLLSRLRISMLHEQALARTDSLTGAANGRTFYEHVCLAVERSLRSLTPLTLAYLDLDNFKRLNDERGHWAGDEALCDVSQTIRRNIRSVDMLARLGGDELALLLPDTGGPEAVIVLNRLRELLAEEMARKGWPVTVSIGAATFLRPTVDVDVMVRHIDTLMYAAKRAGKGRLEHRVVEDAEELCQGGSRLERRATARILSKRLARVRPEGEPESADEFAHVRYVTADGITLCLEREVPEQTLLVVEPLQASGARTLLARVAWTAPATGGTYLHSCELSNRLSDEELGSWQAEQSGVIEPPPQAAKPVSPPTR